MRHLGKIIHDIIERATFDEMTELHYNTATDEDFEFIEDILYPLLCEHLGHSLTLDHCCNPLHDFCEVCRKTVVELGYKRIKNDYPQEWEKI